MLKPRALLFALALSAFVVWRVVLGPAYVWRDVPTVLALASLASLFKRDVSIPAAAWLLGIYAAAHLPRLRELFGA